MGEDGRGDLGPDVGTQDLGGDARVVGHRHRLADVVAERRHHQLVVGAGPLGPGGRLEAVGQLVDGESVDHVGQRLEHGQHPVGHPALVAAGLGADRRPLLGRRDIHPGERIRHRSIVAPIRRRRPPTPGGRSAPGRPPPPWPGRRRRTGGPEDPEASHRRPVEQAERRLEAAQQVAQLGRGREVLLFDRDRRPLDPVHRRQRSRPPRRPAPRGRTPPPSPRPCPTGRRGAPTASLTRTTRGQPKAAATSVRATVLEEFSEPMTTTASHRPARALQRGLPVGRGEAEVAPVGHPEVGEACAGPVHDPGPLVVAQRGLGQEGDLGGPSRPGRRGRPRPRPARAAGPSPGPRPWCPPPPRGRGAPRRAPCSPCGPGPSVRGGPWSRGGRRRRPPPGRRRGPRRPPRAPIRGPTASAGRRPAPRPRRRRRPRPGPELVDDVPVVDDLVVAVDGRFEDPHHPGQGLDGLLHPRAEAPGLGQETRSTDTRPGYRGSRAGPVGGAPPGRTGGERVAWVHVGAPGDDGARGRRRHRNVPGCAVRAPAR